MTQNNNITLRAVIFDMGGVLLRTANFEPRTSLAAEYGLTYNGISDLVFNSPSSHRAEQGLISEADHWKFVQQQLNPLPPDVQVLQDRFWGGDIQDTGLVTFLHSIRPVVKTGLLSNAWSATRASVSQRFNFLDAFDVSIFSAEVGFRKPDAPIYKLMLKRLEVKPGEAVFVDDVLKNVEGALALGMRAIQFDDPLHVMEQIRAMLPA